MGRLLFCGSVGSFERYAKHWGFPRRYQYDVKSVFLASPSEISTAGCGELTFDRASSASSLLVVERGLPAVDDIPRRLHFGKLDSWRFIPLKINPDRSSLGKQGSDGAVWGTRRIKRRKKCNPWARVAQINLRVRRFARQIAGFNLRRKIYKWEPLRTRRRP